MLQGQEMGSEEAGAAVGSDAGGASVQAAPARPTASGGGGPQLEHCSGASALHELDKFVS